MYRQTNANPKKRKTGDCVVRAIATATGQSWHYVYDELCHIGYSKCRMPNSKNVYEYYLKERGWKKNPMPKNEDGRRYTLHEFANSNKDLTAIVSIRSHLTALVDGDILDTWDCSGKCVGNYYTHENN